ncbi:MAG: cupin domain-containing protein [Akkermansiaceae bacterium]
MSAMTLHRHNTKEEFYFLLEGKGRIRVGDSTLTLQPHEGLHVCPEQMRQVFNDTPKPALWLIVGAPEAEFSLDEQASASSVCYPVDPTQLPDELHGVSWPPS